VVKMKKYMFLIGLMMILSLPLVMAESMTRTVPSSVNPGEQFEVTYTVTGASGNYFVSIVDTVTGGCEPEGKHSFFIADDYTFKKSESFTYTAPSTGSCTFSGDYKFGSDAIIRFNNDAVSMIPGSCIPDWDCDDWGDCVDEIKERVCDDGCGNTKTETDICQEKADFCQYMEFAKFVSEENYCTAGIVIILLGIFVLMILFKK